MNGKEFKEALKNPKNVYILVSTDSVMIDLYTNRFKKAINATSVSYGEIHQGVNLFNEVILNVIYIQKLEEELFQNEAYILAHIDSVDKRSAVYKKYQDQIIELENDYTQFIMEHSPFNEKQAREFAKRHNNDLGLIQNSLSIYTASDNTYTRFTNYRDDIYDWVTSFIKKQKLPPCTESPISILALLSNNCQSLLKVKTKDTADLNPYVISHMKELENYITIDELVQIINDCFYLDCQVKKGTIDIDYTLGYMIAKRYNTNEKGGNV